jgi:hypothetical protein
MAPELVESLEDEERVVGAGSRAASVSLLRVDHDGVHSVGRDFPLTARALFATRLKGSGLRVPARRASASGQFCGAQGRAPLPFRDAPQRIGIAVRQRQTNSVVRRDAPRYLSRTRPSGSASPCVTLTVLAPAASTMSKIPCAQ